MAGSPGGVEVSRISVRAVPDTSHLFAELKADLDKIEAGLELNVRASVDSAGLDASARAAVEQAQAAAGDIHVKADVDTSQVGQMERALSGATSGVGSLLSNFSLLGAGASTLGLALIPLTAVIGGLAVALAAPLAIAAGGVSVFGILAGIAVADTAKQIKAIGTLQTRLGTLKKGTAEYQTTLTQLHDAQAALTPAQSAFAKALEQVKAAFHNFPQAVLLKPLTDAMKLLAQVLPTLEPLVRAVSGVFDDLVKQMGKVVQSPGYKGFIHTFAKQLGPDLRAFARIMGNVFVGFGGLFSAVNDQLSQGVLASLVSITDKFAEFGRNASENKGLKSFIGYVKQNLPPIGSLISNTFGIILDVFKDLAPLGSAVLDVLSGIVEQLRRMGPVATPVAAALAGLVIPFGGPEVAVVLGLATAFQEVYKRSKPLQHIIRDIGEYFRTKWLPKIQDASRDVLPAFKSAIHDISQTIRDNKGLFETLGKALVTVGSAAVIGAIETTATTIRGIGKAFKYGTLAVKLWANVTINLFRFIVSGLAAMVQTILAQFGTIVDGAAAAFGWMPKIGGKINAAKDAFHSFEANVVGNINAVGDKLKDLQDKINEVGRSHPSFKVTAQTLEATRALEKLRHEQIPDKSFKITAQLELQIERQFGPGGGIGHPTSGGATANSSAPRTAAPLVNIENAHVADTKDLMRKSAKAVRARAGGGINLFPSATPSLTGA